MRARKVGECHLRPAIAIRFEEPLPAGDRRLVTERAIPCEDRCASIDATLVSRNDVPERRAVVQHVVPRERIALPRRPIAKREVRDRPRCVLERGSERRWRIAPWTDRAHRAEARRGDDHALRGERARLLRRGAERDQIDAAVLRRDVRDDESGSHPAGHRAREMRRDATVAFRPGHDLLRSGAGRAEACREIKEGSPGAGLIEPPAVVVAASVIDEPAKSCRGEAPPVHPRRHGDGVERCDLRVGRPRGDRDRERAPAALVAPGGKPRDLGVESGLLPCVLGRRAGVKPQAFVPPSAIEETLLRLATEELLADDGIARRVGAGHDAHFAEQRDERAVLPHRHGDVVRAPGICRDFVRATARGSAGRRVELQQDEVVDTRALQAPGGSKARHTSSDDRHLHAPRAFRRDHRQRSAIAEPMAENLRTEGQFSRRQRHRLAARARGERGGNPEDSGEEIAALHVTPSGATRIRNSERASGCRGG